MTPIATVIADIFTAIREGRRDDALALHDALCVRAGTGEPMPHLTEIPGFVRGQPSDDPEYYCEGYTPVGHIAVTERLALLVSVCGESAAEHLFFGEHSLEELPLWDAIDLADPDFIPDSDSLPAAIGALLGLR